MGKHLTGGVSVVTDHLPNVVGTCGGGYLDGVLPACAVNNTTSGPWVMLVRTNLGHPREK